METGNSASFTVALSNASTTILEAQNYILFSRSQSNLALKNQGGDTVRLFQKGTFRASMSVSYRTDAPLDQSYARNSEGDYVWTEIPTPGEKNIIHRTNQPPEAIIFIPQSAEVGEPVAFDAADSRDPDNDPMIFYWNFGDGSAGHGANATHLYRETGAYKIELILKAGEHETIERRKITIKESTAVAKETIKIQSSSVHASAIPSAPPPVASIILTEVFPNPVGRDADEFIELYNEGAAAVDLSGWAIELQSGKQKNFLSSVNIQPKEYVTVSQESGFRQLRNSSDELLLIDVSGAVADSIDYEDAPSGYSLARMESGDWAWTKNPTKGKKNAVSIAYSDQEDDSAAKDAPLSKKRLRLKKQEQKKIAQHASIAELSGIKTRTLARVRGRVTVLPGIFDSTSFYIGDKDRGILLKSAKNAFPLLSMGQEIEAQGKFSKLSAGFAIVIASLSDITILPAKPALLEPFAIPIAAISDDRIGALIRVRGDISVVRWPHIYINEGDKELRVYIKKNTGIPKLPLLAGQTLDIVGILQKTPADYRLLPREEKDVVITASSRSMQSEKKEIYAVPASGPNVREYGTAALVAAIVVFGGLMVRSYRRKKLKPQDGTIAE